VHEALKLLQDSLPSNIKFEQHISEKCGPVLAGPTQIHQVIMNLGANAIDAMRKNGGTLQVSVAETTISDTGSNAPAGLDSGPYLKMSVSDTGHGIDLAIRDRIFDPFFTTKTPGNGTGMGLSIVHGIVKECDGTIDVHSETDRGTTLTIYLPLFAEQSESTGKAIDSPLNGGDRFTILVVDDDKTLRLTLRQHLQDAGYNVAEAPDGRKALKILATESVNLVLTDIRMPEMDGFELMAHMSADYPIIPTMVMTGYGTPETTASFEEMGSLQVMDKPLDLDDLTRRITESLHQVSQGGTMTGISVASFLQLIQLEQKTCVLEVHGKNGQNGFLYFNQGVLCDAVCGQLKQEEATLEIVSWENVLLNFNALPRKKTQRKIKTDLMSLLLEGLKQKDETRA
jgi:CheY-like chemotaxis protein